MTFVTQDCSSAVLGHVLYSKKNCVIKILSYFECTHMCNDVIPYKTLSYCSKTVRQLRMSICIAWLTDRAIQFTTQRRCRTTRLAVC